MAIALISHARWELTPLLCRLISQNSLRRRGCLCHVYFCPHPTISPLCGDQAEGFNGGWPSSFRDNGRAAGRRRALRLSNGDKDTWQWDWCTQRDGAKARFNHTTIKEHTHASHEVKVRHYWQSVSSLWVCAFDNEGKKSYEKEQNPSNFFAFLSKLWFQLWALCKHKQLSSFQRH